VSPIPSCMKLAFEHLRGAAAQPRDLNRAHNRGDPIATSPRGPSCRKRRCPSWPWSAVSPPPHRADCTHARNGQPQDPELEAHLAGGSRPCWTSSSRPLLVYPAIRHLTAFECLLGRFIISHLLFRREVRAFSPAPSQMQGSDRRLCLVTGSRDDGTAALTDDIIEQLHLHRPQIPVFSRKA
jgi:hypothetical protein